MKIKFLFQHRDEGIEISPGHWAYFGGHVEKGATIQEALKREILEEIEYEVSDATLFMTQDFNSSVGPSRKFVFICKFDSSQKLVQHEGQGMAWLTPDEFCLKKTLEHDVEVVLKLKEQLKKIKNLKRFCGHDLNVT
jgi:8-oxo-dGTP diphosphatase